MAVKKISDADSALKSELLREVNCRLAELNEGYQALVSRAHAVADMLDSLKNSEDANADELFDLEMQLDALSTEQRRVEGLISREREMLAKVNLIGSTSSEEPGQDVADRPRKTPLPKKKQERAVPTAAFNNRQIDLFRDVMANSDSDRDSLSNAIDLWDNVPRYAMSRARQEKIRLKGGFLPLTELDFQYKGKPYAAQIRPARIEVKNKNGELTGETIEFYPGAREELVEHALRKLAAEQQFGFFDTATSRSGVTFTLHQLRTELAERGHAMKFSEIVESLDIMNLSNIRLIDKGSNSKDPSLLSQPYLPTLIKVNKDGLASDPSARWLVQFHGCLTESIAQLTYRQFNYQRLMKCTSQLSRWLISQLVLKYTAAALDVDFKMRFSTIKRDSGLLDNYARQRAAIEALDDAWTELKTLGVLMRVNKKEDFGLRGKIEDVEYELKASMKFISEQKAANKRLKDAGATVDKLP